MKATTEIHEAAGGLVVSDPGILGGKPVFRGTRLPVETLFEYLADGRTLPANRVMQESRLSHLQQNPSIVRPARYEGT